MKRTHQEELMARILFRAIRETKDLNKASLIVMGDYVEGDNVGDQLGNMLKVYNLKISECLRIQAFINGQSKEL